GGNAPVPAEFERMQGALTPETSLPAIRQFLNDGGTVIAVGTATTLGYALGLPIENQMMVKSPGEPDRPLTGEEYYVPGSILSVAVDNTTTAGTGLEKKVDVFFDNSPVFRLKPEGGERKAEGGRRRAEGGGRNGKQPSAFRLPPSAFPFLAPPLHDLDRQSVRILEHESARITERVRWLGNPHSLAAQFGVKRIELVGREADVIEHLPARGDQLLLG